MEEGTPGTGPASQKAEATDCAKRLRAALGYRWDAYAGHWARCLECGTMNAFLAHRHAMRSLLRTADEQALHDAFIQSLLEDSNGDRSEGPCGGDATIHSGGFTASLETSLSLAVHQDLSYASLPTAAVGPCTALIAQALQRRLRTALEVASKRKRKRCESELADLLATSSALYSGRHRPTEVDRASFIIEITDEDFNAAIDAIL